MAVGIRIGQGDGAIRDRGLGLGVHTEGNAVVHRIETGRNMTTRGDELMQYRYELQTNVTATLYRSQFNDL